MDGSDGLSRSVESLYRAIVRATSLRKSGVNTVDPNLVAELAIELAVGGAVRPQSNCTDLASTGGPGSISTMLVPLMTRAAGVAVAKVGVPGRPAGAVDSLANVPGYRWSSTADEFDRAMSDCGFAHTAANEHWAPGDAVLFRQRQTDGTQSVPALVVASLLSKKFAAGVRYPGFEVRAARHGNFGSTPDEVRRNASLLREVAGCLDMHATVFITDANYPHQPWIGRGEAVAALSMTVERGGSGGPGVLGPDSWSTAHLRSCEQMARALVAASMQGEASHHAATSAFDEPSGEYILDVSAVLTAHLIAHGATREGLEDHAAATVAAAREVLTAPTSGFVHYRMDGIRDHLVRANNRVSGLKVPVWPPFADHAGAVLHVPPGCRVKSGAAVLSLRWPKGESFPDSHDLFDITDQPHAHRSADGSQLQETID